MPSIEQTAHIYQELAQWHGQHGQLQLRDRFLLLQADTYFAGGKTDEAEKVRGQLLAVNPHHLIKPFDSFAEALKSIDVKNYVEGLRRQYDPNKARELLRSLGSQKEAQAAAKGATGASPSGKSGAHPQPDAPKVYRFQEEKGEGPSFPAGVPIPPRGKSAEEIPRRPVSSIPLGRVNPAAPTANPEVTDISPRSPRWLPPETSSSWLPEGNDAERAEFTAGAWVATGLYWVLLVAGLGLTAYTLGGPFLAR
ncbi:MAG TPA: hypothetical protein VGY77_12130 [Gemmataceae bacterium]|jgi:hypothetical protein|nr:hypothetical protein [Gemmataceae bacterium]